MEESPYVEFVDINRSCIAILSDIYNADVDGGIYYDWYSKYGININEFMVWAEVEAEVDEEIAGKLKTRMYYLRVKEGKTYLIRVFLDPFASMNQYGDRMTVGIRPLEEGVWFLEGEPDGEIPEKYMSEDAALQERNRHAMVAITTTDMSSMPWAQESTKFFYLEEGRWLNRQDQEEGRMVCVVMKRFAEIRGLSVGETLTLTLQDKEAAHGGYSLNTDDTWETDDKTEVTLEIVGIYGNLYGGLANDPGWISLTY